MSETTTDASTPKTNAKTQTESDESTLAAELEVLREENKRLREEYVSARRSQYRKTAVALAAIGLAAVIAGAFFSNARTVLLAIGGTGVFLGVLTYYLTPERFLSASIGRGVYGALADNESALVGELGLREERVYVPFGSASGFDDVRLFVPHAADYELPDENALTDVLVVTDRDRERGISFRPTGSALVDEFEQAITLKSEMYPVTLAEQLTDALVEQFELVRSATAETDADGGRITVAVTESAYGSIERFDHPVASFLAVGIAGGLGVAVELSVETRVEDDRTDAVVTCRWEQNDRRETVTEDQSP